MTGRIAIAAALLISAPALAQTAPVPSAEAEALGRQVAESGTLAAVLPLMTAKDTEALIAEHPELGAAAKAKLRSVAAATARSATDRLMATIGHQYAERLSIADLKAVLAFDQSPAAKAWRAAEPAAIMAAVKTLQDYDFKDAAWRAYCGPAGACSPAK